MIAILLFLCVIALVLIGYPVAWTLAGAALIFMLVGIAFGGFDATWLYALNTRLFGILTNDLLIAVPLFIFMGTILQKSRVAENLLESFVYLFRNFSGGLGITVVLFGALLAASTGVVSATVVTMGLLSLPIMLKHRYHPAVASGTICAAGTLGQIIPPSIVLVLLGDTLSSAYQKAQLDQGIFSPDTISVTDLFAGALIPGLVLVGLYMAYLITLGMLRPHALPPATANNIPSVNIGRRIHAVIAPVLLIIGVLGSILLGIATSTEAAAIGVAGAMAIAASQKALTKAVFAETTQRTARMTCMVFAILIGASFFSLAFRGYGGDDVVHEMLSHIPAGRMGALLAVMLFIFLLGFILDFIEITLIIVPIVGPILMQMGFDPVWLGVMLAINLQTSFLTPPFGFSLFFLRGVAPPEVTTKQIYIGVAPFVGLQIVLLIILIIWPELATWLPDKLFGA